MGQQTRSVDLFHASHASASKVKKPKGSDRVKGAAFHATHEPAGKPKRSQPPVVHAGDVMSTVFGAEGPVEWRSHTNFDATLDLASNFQNKRLDFIQAWRELARFTYGDDRVPFNDISNWAYSRAVAAFFKAAVAKLWIEEHWPADMRTLPWRLVAVGYPGLESISEAVRITDVLARRDWVQNKLNRFQHLLEDEVPLGNEVYRDENGAIFIAAEVEGVPLDKLTRAIIDPALDPADDLQPSVRGGYAATVDRPFAIWDAINQMKERQPLSIEQFQGWWVGRKERVVCPVCKLRPMAEKGEAEERSLCQICFERRQRLKQSAKWIRGEKDTIWIDEVADLNGICALVVGRLGLKGWLENDLEENHFRVLEKQPDFMRVQSAWQTTLEFWEQIAGSILQSEKLSRLSLTVEEHASLCRTYVYETALLGGELALVWTGDEFRTASNLDYFRKQAGLDPSADLARLLQGKRLWMRLPQGYEKEDAGSYEEREKAGTLVTVKSVRDAVPYRPVIAILAQPRHFLAIVPAAHALAACGQIRAQFSEAFGKVRSLLPLTLGIVFFDRRTPIYAVMQAGHKLLRMPEVDETIAAGQSPREPYGGDPYYSRVRVVGNEECASAYLKDLAPEAQFRRAVSLFDFLHLETTAHRYRLGYRDLDAKRLDPAASTRALSFESYERLERVWSLLATGLTTTQINALFAAIEQKREEWGLSYPAQDSVLMRLAGSLVDAAEWEPGPPLGQDRTLLLDGIAEGLFRDAVELHMKILKQGGREE
jgi:hypothetical protein